MSYGRRKIYSDAKEITAANVKDEVSKALSASRLSLQIIRLPLTQKLLQGIMKILRKGVEL